MGLNGCHNSTEGKWPRYWGQGLVICQPSLAIQWHRQQQRVNGRHELLSYWMSLQDGSGDKTAGEYCVLMVDDMISMSCLLVLSNDDDIAWTSKQIPHPRSINKAHVIHTSSHWPNGLQTSCRYLQPAVLASPGVVRWLVLGSRNVGTVFNIPSNMVVWSARGGIVMKTWHLTSLPLIGIR